MRMTRTCRTGLRLIFLGLIPLLCWVAWFYTRTWVLLDVPISLSKGTHFSAGEFTANMNRRYSIEINAVVKDRTESSSEKLPCPFGSQFTSKGVCQIAPELNTHWVLSSEGETVQGDFRENVEVGMYALSNMMASFDCKRGKHYKLDVYVLSDSSSLNVTNPHLYVAVLDDEYMLGQLLTRLLSIVCGLLAAIGGVMLIGSFLKQRGQTGGVKATS
jgi:hypothetical protein